MGPLIRLAFFAGPIVWQGVKKLSLHPSLNKPWPLDKRQGFQNGDWGKVAEILVDGKPIQGWKAASPVAHRVLRLKQDKGTTYSLRQPCACKGLHDYKEGDQYCWPMEIVRGKVEIRWKTSSKT